jgi:gamma-F420-2:alpha-L-glutamate ligase
MRGWLLYQDSDGSVKPDDYATERLQECAKSRGIELDVVRPANFDLVVTRDDRKSVGRRMVGSRRITLVVAR